MATQTTAEAVAALTARTQQVLNAATAISAQGGDLNVAVTTANAKAVTATNKAAEALASQTSAAASAAAALASAAAAEASKANAASSAATASSAVAGAVKNVDLAAASIRSNGAIVNGVADDTAAIAAARASVSASGGVVHFGGKTFATGFFENLSPIVQEWIIGSASAYATGMIPSKPLTSHKVFNGTPQAGGGFAAFAHRVDTYTKAGVDVASTVGFASVVNALSSNTGGAATTNNTNQVAILASAAAQDATASAPVTGLNAIASTAYTGATWQPVVGVESDVAVVNPPGFFGQAGKSTGIGYSAILSESSTENATAAYSADTSKAGKGFLFGAYLAGQVNAGLVVARNTVTPDTGAWVSAAKTYGMYIGPKPLYDLGPGKVPAYDSDHVPAVAFAIGQTAANNGRSGYQRFVETNAAGAELTTDLFRSGLSLNVAMNGTIVVSISETGALLINGQQVLSGRQTGWSHMTGTADRSTVINTDTATLQQLARKVKALEDLAFFQGMAGT